MEQLLRTTESGFRFPVSECRSPMKSSCPSARKIIGITSRLTTKTHRLINISPILNLVFIWTTASLVVQYLHSLRFVFSQVHCRHLISEMVITDFPVCSEILQLPELHLTRRCLEIIYFVPVSRARWICSRYF